MTKLERIICNVIKTQLADDLEKFSIKLSLFQIYFTEDLNIKNVAYRSLTLFVAAMGRIINVRASSCFDIIEKLEEKQELSKFAMQKLIYAVAIACEIRLRWYMRNEHQTDHITKKLNEINLIKTFFSIVGIPSTFSYFKVAYALQCDFAKRLKLKKKHFYFKPQLLNLSLFSCLHDDSITKQNCMQLSNWVGNLEQQEILQNFDKCLLL